MYFILCVLSTQPTEGWGVHPHLLTNGKKKTKSSKETLHWCMCWETWPELVTANTALLKKYQVSGLGHQKWKAELIAIKGFGFFFFCCCFFVCLFVCLFFVVFFCLPLETSTQDRNRNSFINPIVGLCLPNALGKIRGGDWVSASRRNLGYSQESWSGQCQEDRSPERREGSFVEISSLPVLPPSLISKHWWLLFLVHANPLF